MSLINLIFENVTLPFSDFITGQSVASKLKFLRKSQWWNREQIDHYQNGRLKYLIEHAYSTVPYYHDLFNSLKLKPKDISNKEDLQKIPILTKDIIKKEGTERFVSNSFPKRKIVKKSSSGSTGEPLFYYTSKEAYSMNIAASLRGWYWMGYRLGDKYIKLSQNPRKNIIKQLQDKVSRNFYLATNPLVEKNFKYILEQIESYQPAFIRCYPDPLLFLARYKKQHPKYNFSPVAITTTGNTLFPEIKKEIEESFDCKIFDSYNCEGNSTVFECPAHKGYHSAEEYGISEILGEKGHPFKKGTGRLISTDLWNLAHPFIRYDTQDLVDVEPGKCSCNRSLLKIRKILGRNNDILHSKGRDFIVHNFTGFFQTDFFELKRSIDQFQIVKKPQKVIFRLIVNNKFNENVASFIKKYWQDEMKTPVEIQIVDHIPLTQSGKHRFIIKEEQ